MREHNYRINNYKVLASQFRKSNPYKAILFYERAYSCSGENKEIELLFEMALLYDELDEDEKAEEKYYEILNIIPTEERAYYGLAILCDKKEEYNKAIEFFQEAIKLNPQYHKAFFFMANTYDQMGNKDKAIEYYKKALEIKENDFWTYINLGAIYEEINENQKALKMIEKAMELDPEHYIVHFNMGVVYGKLGRLEEAELHYKNSLVINPKYPYSYLNLAVLHKEQKDYAKAREVISEGINNVPDASFLYYNRACILVHLQELDDALVDLLQATKLSPGLIEYMEKDEELDEIKKLRGYRLAFGKRNEITRAD